MNPESPTLRRVVGHNTEGHIGTRKSAKVPAGSFGGEKLVVEPIAFAPNLGSLLPSVSRHSAQRAILEPGSYWFDGGMSHPHFPGDRIPRRVVSATPSLILGGGSQLAFRRERITFAISGRGCHTPSPLDERRSGTGRPSEKPGASAVPGCAREPIADYPDGEYLRE